MQIRGAMKSQTILPMPQGMTEVFTATQVFYSSRGEDVNLTLKTSYENAVMKWSTICNEVLKQSSLIAFANGANPTPRNEIEFWNARNKNLESIYDQLVDPRVRKMGEYLEITNSAYNNTYKNMFKNVVAALFEARDICMYLKTILLHISRFEDNEFLDTESFIKPLVHCIGLLWANSKYYSSSDKIVILLKMISNLLIDSAERSLDPSNIFQGDPEEVHAKLELSIKLINMFMQSFEYVRENLSSYYRTPEEGEEEVVQKPWTFHRKNVFQRLLDFKERLHLVKDILMTLIEFTKLEKVELGGIKGRLLSQKCVQIFEEFNKAYNVFNNIQYEILDTTDHSIIKDATVFNEKCSDFDRRLAAIFAQAYEDCYNLESIFKFINVLGPLINRKAINDEVTVKYHKIIDQFNFELDTVKELYDNGKKNGIPLDKYYPEVAGELLWLHKLRARISRPAEDLKILENDIVKSEDAVNVFMKIEQMTKILDAEQNKILRAWFNYAPEQIEKSMSKFQLVRIDNGFLLELNFDEELQAILREMRYMMLMEIQDIPEKALKLYEKAEELEASMSKFYRIVEWYNYIKTNTTEFEFALIEAEMEDIDSMLQEVTDVSTWNTNGKFHFNIKFDQIPYSERFRKSS